MKKDLPNLNKCHFSLFFQREPQMPSGAQVITPISLLVAAVGTKAGSVLCLTLQTGLGKKAFIVVNSSQWWISF